MKIVNLVLYPSVHADLLLMQTLSLSNNVTLLPAARGLNINRCCFGDFAEMTDPVIFLGRTVSKFDKNQCPRQSLLLDESRMHNLHPVTLLSATAVNSGPYI